MKPLIAAMQLNEAYQCRNAAALQRGNSLYEKQAQTIKSNSLFLYKGTPYIQLLTT